MTGAYDLNKGGVMKKGGAADARHTIDKSTLKNSADRNIRLKAQEIRDIQPGDMPPPPTNKAATSYLDVGQLTPTGDFGSRCDDDGGKAGICGHEEPANQVMHDHVQEMNERRQKELKEKAEAAPKETTERMLGFTDELAYKK